MLSTTLTEALSGLINHEDGVRKLAPEIRKQHWLTVRLALDDAASSRVKTSRSQTARLAARHAAGVAPTGGRPASVFYTVAMGSLWEVRVLGVPAALDLVTETLAENKGNGPAPKAGSLAVAMSRSGHWYRHLTTSNGEYGLTVAKARNQTP